MEKRKKSRHAQAGFQVERMRRLYSQIGQPLPVDVIIDLHRHLDVALELAQQERGKPCKAKKACSRLH